MADGAVVPLDTALSNSSDITFDTGTSTFTITTPGNYYVTWWVAADGAGASTFVEFSIQVNGTDNISASTPITTGQLSGSAVVTLAAGDTITLVNTTGETAGFGAVPIQANVVILQTLV